VLVVEDSVTSREMISNILEGAGYDVSGAADGSEAWKKLAAEEFDLVVTDLDMPVMDGLELTRRIRTGPSRPDLPVIVVTTLGGDEEKVRGLQAGANAYIVKRQFDQGALLARARELTGSR
jgi:two-component system chemotaxis sensor kinase CheA